MTKRKKFALEDLIVNAGGTRANKRDRGPGGRHAAQIGVTTTVANISEKPDGESERVARGGNIQGGFQRRGSKFWQGKTATEILDEAGENSAKGK